MPNNWTTIAPPPDRRGGQPRATLVTVVIPSLHRPDLVQQCLASLAQQSLAASDFEVLIVENYAQPESMPAPPLPENVRCIPLAENLGTTGSVNRALEQSNSEYVLLLNNDVRLGPQYLELLLARLRCDASLGFASGKLLNALRPGVLDGCGDALLRGGGAYRLGHDDADQGRFADDAPILAGCGAATLFRRSVLHEVGGLDEDFFAYLDDIDLGLRIQLAGYRGIYAPEALAWHLGSTTLGNVLHPRITELLTRNQLFLLMKNYPAGVLFRLSGLIVVFQLLWLFLVLRRHHFRPYLRGLAGAVLCLPRMLAKRRRVLRRCRLTSTQIVALLHASERQIFDWQAALPESSRSRLLSAYFRYFHPRRQ